MLETPTALILDFSRSQPHQPQESLLRGSKMMHNAIQNPNAPAFVAREASLKAGDGTRTHNSQLGRLDERDENLGKTVDLQTAQPPAQPYFVPDSDLSAIIENWNLLGPSIKLAIMALVRIAMGSERK